MSVVMHELGHGLGFLGTGNVSGGQGTVGASTMYWAYDKSDGYGLLDPAGNEKPVLLGELVRPYPERVAGIPLGYSFDPHVQPLIAAP